MINPNLYPIGSEEWINAKLALIEPQLRKMLMEQAAARGITDSGIVEKALYDQLDRYRQQYMAEASERQQAAEEAEKTRQANERMAKEERKAQERGAMWSGLGQLGGYALFSRNPKTGATGLSELYNWFKPATKTETILPNSSLIDNSAEPIAITTKTPTFGSSYGLAGLGALAGNLMNKERGLWSGLSGLASAYGAGSKMASGGSQLYGLAPLAASFLPSKGKILKGDNLWRTLLGLGGLAASFL